MTIFCSNCSAANEDFAEFCASCGEPIEKVDEDERSSATQEGSKEQTEDTTSQTEKGKSKFYRSRTNKIVAGISAAFANEFNMDIDLVRILWIIFFVITGGTAVLIYLVLWIAIPLEPETAAEETDASES